MGGATHSRWTMMVGIDGGMLRARNKKGFFEVIAGKSISPSNATKHTIFPPPNALALCRLTTRTNAGGYGSC